MVMSTEPLEVNEAPAPYLAKAGVQGVPPGYKRTEVGVIPVEWESVRIGALANVLRGASPRPIDSPIWFDERSAIGWLRISDVTAAGKYLYETEQNLSEAGIANSRAVKRGNLVMSICATVGRPVLLRKDVCIHDGFVVFQNLKADKEYMYYVLANIERHWSRHGQTGSQMNLNTSLISATPIPVPTPTEQRAIAEALSDVDDLLAALDKLIAKKRAIKQAAMQQLLTGKTRLPGFSGPWETKRLGDVLKVRHGRSQRNVVVPDGKFPILASGGEIGRTNTALYERPSVLIGRKGTIDEPQFISSPFWTVDTLFYTEICDGAYAKFIFYKFCMIPWLSYNEASGVPSLNARTIENIEITLPEVEEQTAIATVLSDMDAEIAALEARRDKVKRIKQGMMQQLLTGRIRLMQPSRETAPC